MGSLYNRDSSGNVTLGGSIILPMTNAGVPVPSAVASPLEYNEQITFTTSLSGCFTVASYPIRIFRINNLVFLALPLWSGTATASTTNVSGSALATRFIPSSTLKFVAPGVRAGVILPIAVEVSSSGIITFYGDVNGGNFANGSSASCFATSLFYYVP